ncbi:MAG TPA: amino acid adenylation domain-containing protein [Bryobacteraceae bacterium]|nr:amino acid adenylation domain-containing protein [Bryobacteraceae bacterium]
MNQLQQLITSEEYRDHADYWKDALKGIEGEFRLAQNWSLAPADGPLVTFQFRLPESVNAFIGKVARESDLAAFTVILAAVFQLVRIYSREDVVRLGSPKLSSSGGAANDGMIPLVCRYESGITVREFLDRVGTTVSTSYTYQDFPVETQAGAAARSNVRIHFDGVHEPLPQISSHGLNITVERAPDIRICLVASPREFEEGFLRGFARHLGNILHSFQQLDTLLDDVEVMDEEERARVAQAHVSGSLAEGTVLDLFQRQCAISPYAVALVLPDREVTYEELDRQSDLLAVFLRDEYGIQPGDAVGVLADRSHRWIVGVLGILKAAGVYVPLDPEYPSERLRFMIEDSGVKALLVHSDYLAALTDLWSLPMFALDFQLDTLEESSARPPVGPGARDAAYIIYTSGSTGKPKGALLEHRGLLNVVLHHIEAFGFHAHDRLTQFYSPSFDGSLLEIFITLGCGARLVMAPPALIRDAGRYSQYLEEQAVTAINAPPVYLRQLNWSRLGAVKCVISAGDSARTEDAQNLAASRVFHNSYGPTEATVCATDYVMEAGRRYGSRIPIGKPIRNTSVYLMDEHLRPVPEGCVGEICIAGVALARHYLNHADLTRAAFVAHPFQAGERIYRTGDLGVQRPDGNLEWLGREDGQVKIRGYRIETGEIESVLRRRDGVQDAAVVARKGDGGERRLVAYIASSRELATNDLREFLVDRLPAYMVPAAFVVLAALPLSPNGKIDRKALAAMSMEGGEREQYAAPQSETEQRLAEVWAEVLRLPRVGVQDNFFALGGDSILILQVVSRAQRAGIRITPQQMFEHQTVSALAAVATATGRIEAQQDAVTGAVPLTAAGRWFFAQPIGNRHQYNQSVLLELPGGLRRDWIEQAVARLTDHHDALRLRFRQVNGDWEQAHVQSSEARVRETILAGLAIGEVDAAIEAEAARLHASLKLSDGPVFAAHLFRLSGSGPDRLLVVAHHLVVDGVSWRILLQDLHTAVTQLREGAAIQLPPKTTSFQHWARRLAGFAKTEYQAKEYWMQLAARAVPPIPVDRHAGPLANRHDSAERVVFSLDELHTGQLLHQATKTSGLQAQEVLLAALAATLREWSGAGTVCVGMEGHGREDLFEDVDLSRTAGWFTALYPLVLDVPSGDPGELLQAVKEQFRAVPLRGLGYGIGRYVRAEPAFLAVGAPLDPAEILFNYVGQVDHALSQEGWKLLPEPVGGERSPDCPRTHLLEIESLVSGGLLKVSWTYSRNFHERATIERLAARYRENLNSLIEYCCSPTPRPLQPEFKPLVARAQS